MADCVHPQLLKDIKQLLGEAGSLTEENVNFLKDLGEMYEIFLGLTAENGDDKRETALAKRYKNAVKRILWNVLFNSYLELKTKSTRTSILFSEIENTEKEGGFSKTPEAMKLKVKDGKYYLGKAKECIEKIDKDLPSLFKRVREARRNKTQSGIKEGDIEELEMDAQDVEQEFKKCESYLEGADKAVSELKIEIENEFTRHKIKLVAQAAGIAGGLMLGKALLQGTDLWRSTVEQIGVRISGALGLSGVAALSVSFGLHFYQQIEDFQKNLSQDLYKLQSELEKMRKECKLRQEDFEIRVTKRMKHLKT